MDASGGSRGRAGRPSPLRRSRLLGVLFLLLITAPAVAQTGPDYGARPVGYGTEGLQGLRFDHGVEAGWFVDDAVEIFNYTDEPMPFRFYGADMVEAADGTPTPAARDADRDGAGAWLAVEQHVLEVAPHSTVLAGFRANVPYGTPPGEYTAAILVEPDRATGGGIFQHRTRIGMPVHITVVTEIDHAVEVGALRKEIGEDGVRFSVPVTNSGNVTFAAVGRVRLEVTGAERDPVLLSPGNVHVAPGDTVVLQGTWDTSPWLGRVAAQAVVGTTVGRRPVRSFASDALVFWLIPWRDVLIVLALVIALAVLWRRTDALRHAWLERRREERELVRAHRAERAAREHHAGV